PTMFPQSGVYLELHSFPTRRSSDLIPTSINTPDDAESNVVKYIVNFEADFWNVGFGDDTSGISGDSIYLIRVSLVTGMPCWLSRSEEHTSELQSRENLVCRLLLEKK